MATYSRTTRAIMPADPAEQSHRVAEALAAAEAAERHEAFAKSAVGRAYLQFPPEVHHRIRTSLETAQTVVELAPGEAKRIAAEAGVSTSLVRLTWKNMRARDQA